MWRAETEASLDPKLKLVWWREHGVLCYGCSKQIRFYDDQSDELVGSWQSYKDTRSKVCNNSTLVLAHGFLLLWQKGTKSPFSLSLPPPPLVNYSFLLNSGTSHLSIRVAHRRSNDNLFGKRTKSQAKGRRVPIQPPCYRYVCLLSLFVPMDPLTPSTRSSHFIIFDVFNAKPLVRHRANHSSVEDKHYQLTLCPIASNKILLTGHHAAPRTNQPRRQKFVVFNDEGSLLT